VASYTLTYDKDVFTELSREIAAAPTTMNIYVTRTIAKEVDAYVVRNLVNVNIPKPTYPLVWKSQKQRRYVMAKLRKEGNLPYRRTGAFQKAWKTAAAKGNDGSILTVSNDSGITEYVTGSGPERQPMFPQWYKYEDTLLKAEELASDLAINAWFDILSFGGVQAGSTRPGKGFR
jgi:hypothetical protein